MAANFSLIIEDDAGKQMVVAFSKDVITIGRKEGNTIRLTERNVSRFHAKLVKANGHVVVEDLSSFNGIKLNGDRIAGTAQVTSGDVIEIGDYHLELRAAQPASPGPVGIKSVGMQHGNAGGDDFEGDTQRWEPPPAQPPTLRLGPPVLARSEQGPAHGGFGDDSGDTEKLDLSKLAAASANGQSAQAPPAMPAAQSWPAPARPAPPAPSFSALTDLEPTARQPIANVPLGGGPAPPPPMAAPVVSPAAAAPSLADTTQDMPALRGAVEAAAQQEQARPVPAPRSAATPSPPPSSSAAGFRHVEETEQFRPAPSGAAAQDLSLPRLVALNTMFAGSTFPLAAMEVVLGRTDDNDIVIEHRSISRNHAKFVRHGERVEVLDLRSANGVLVNGNEVEQHTLRGGDIVELGRVRLRFVNAGESFVVTPEDIERARLADHGPDDDDPRSSSLSQRPSSAASSSAKPVVLYAVLGILALLVVVLLVLLLRGGGAAAGPVAAGDSAATGAAAALATTTTTTADAAAAAAPAAAGATTAPADAVAAAASATAGAATTAGAAAASAAASNAAGDAKRDGAAVAAPNTVGDVDVDTTAQVRSDPARTATRTLTKKEVDARIAEARSDYVIGKHRDAIAKLLVLVSAAPRNPEVHRQLGINYAKDRQRDKAIASFQRAVEIDPSGPVGKTAQKSLDDLRRSSGP